MGTAVAVMILIVAAVVLVVALVLMGIEGRLSSRAPEISVRLARAARHLNGDGRVPPRFEKLFH